MNFIEQDFTVRFRYKVFFTTDLFSKANTVLRSFLKSEEQEGIVKKLLFVIDGGVANSHPTLTSKIREYFQRETNFQLVEQFLILPGGEASKNNEEFFYSIVKAVNHQGIDRHSYLIAIGGGSILDLAGYAAAVSHRGIRHIRIPTTVLSQNDSGVGVKNGINFFNKKNFLGTFAPPVAVLNDSNFLTTLNTVDWRSGISEAIKVALIKDAAFFDWLCDHAKLLIERDMETMQYLIHRCAELHMQHIAGKDPFESGSSRPLDFGHWSAHKLEQLTNFTIRHGEAVAIGIALDSVYSFLSTRLSESALNRILNLMKALGFLVVHPLLEVNNEKSPLLDGLNEFREHLGGQLTITLLRDIGVGEEVHEIDANLVKDAYQWLIKYSTGK
jgi:3-dehydroquinate synthase